MPVSQARRERGSQGPALLRGCLFIQGEGAFYVSLCRSTSHGHIWIVPGKAYLSSPASLIKEYMAVDRFLVASLHCSFLRQVGGDMGGV